MTTSSVSENRFFGDISEKFHFNSFFTKENYVKKENSPYCLHFLMFFNQPRASLEKTITPARIDAKCTERQITPLHLAVMKNDPELVAMLLLRGANRNARDKFGYTPLHYAACLTNETIIKHLKMGGADASARTYLGMTCEQIRIHRGLDPAIWSQGKISVREGSNETVVDLWSPEAVHEHLGLKAYTDEIQFSDSLEASSSESNRRELQLQAPKLQMVLSQQKIALKAKPPALCVAEAVHLKALGSSRFGKELLAGQAFKRGEPIGVYGGKLAAKPKGRVFEDLLMGSPSEADDAHTYSSHLGLNVDPREAGNAMRFINDDFPNCSVKGDDLLVTADAPIAKGESLTTDYGVGHVSLKWGRYLIGKTEELKSYFSTESLTSHWKKNIGAQRGLSTVFQTIERQSKCFYLFQTPAAAIYACLSQAVKPEEMIAVLKNPEHGKLLGFSGCPQHYVWLAKTLLILQSLETNLAKKGNLASEVRTFLLEQLHVLSVTQMAQTLHLIAEETALPDFSNERWETLKETVKREMPSFMWHQDKRFILPRFTDIGLAEDFGSYPELKPLMQGMGLIG